MFRVVVEQNSAVSIVDENGSVLFLVDGLITNNYISRLTKPYPKKVGWMDLYGVVSELVDVPPLLLSIGASICFATAIVALSMK